MKVFLKSLALALGVIYSSLLWAHHNTQAEYGPFDSPYIHVTGIITNIKWGNPHIAFTITITGGDLPEKELGKSWQVNDHPINVIEDYGFNQDDFHIGDTLDLLTWTHVRHTANLWPRAIKINDGPLRSNLRFTDMIDIAKGTFVGLGIQPPANLNGSAPGRAGDETVKKLAEMGLLDATGNMIWPPPPKG